MATIICLTQFPTLTPHMPTMVDELWLFWCTWSSSSSFNSVVHWHFGPKIITEATSEITVKCSLQAIYKWRSLQVINSFRLAAWLLFSMQQEHWVCSLKMRPPGYLLLCSLFDFCVQHVTIRWSSLATYCSINEATRPLATVCPSTASATLVHSNVPSFDTFIA